MVVLVTDNPPTFQGLVVADGVRRAAYFHLDAPDPNLFPTTYHLLLEQFFLLR
jgi:hypothetical protein